MAPKDAHDDEGAKRKRTVRNFPASSFAEPLDFAKAILEFGGSQPVRRLSIFDHLGKSPESGPSRMLITNANKYGLTEGSYASELITLTDDGRRAVADDTPPRERARSHVKLAIQDIPLFNTLYERFVNNKLPAKAALIDAAIDNGASKDAAEEAVDTFVVNLRFVNLLQTLSGADRIVSVDHLLDTIPSTTPALFRPSTPIPVSTPLKPVNEGRNTVHADFNSTCFYIIPIEQVDTEERKHSDLFLESIVQPALEPFNLRVVRADHIDKPGVITKQIIDYLVHSKLVIVDLSFHNPNVFYELAIRHMMRKPVVQITRQSEHIPFDVNTVRTIVIDTATIYTLVPQLETHKSEIAAQVRQALENPDSADNPISMYYPGLTVNLAA